MKVFVLMTLFTCLYATRFQELAMTEAKKRAPQAIKPQSLLQKRPNLEQEATKFLQLQNLELPAAQSMQNLQFLQESSNQEFVELPQDQIQDVLIQLPQPVSQERTQLIETNTEQILIQLPEPVQMSKFIQLPPAQNMKISAIQTDPVQILLDLEKLQETKIQLPPPIQMKNTNLVQTQSQKSHIQLPSPKRMERLLQKNEFCHECQKLQDKEKAESGEGILLKRRFL